MLCLLSPAKTLDLTPAPVRVSLTQPTLLTEVHALLPSVKSLSEDNLQSLMHISPKLAAQAAQQFQDFSPSPPQNHLRPAILTFAGEVYRGLDARSLDEEALQFAHEHVAVLSGLYGVLRALDGMQPYRLEMGTRLQTDRGVGLYPYWGDRVTQQLNALTQSHADRTVINLASKEYSRVVLPKKLHSQMITVDFKENRDGKLKTLGVYAKRARGTLARYVVDHRLTHPEAIKAFTGMDYRYSAEHSTDSTWVFTR